VTGISLGLVTAIAAPAALKLTFTGDGGHAAGAHTRPPFSSTSAVSDTRKHPTHPKHPLTPS